MRRCTANIGFGLVLLAGLAAFACDDAAEGTDADEDDCNLSSFYEGSDSFPEDLEESMEPFFDCPSTFALPWEALPYKSQNTVITFGDYVRYQAIQWVDASFLECCDLGEDLTGCLEASYETAEGAVVYYRLEEIAVTGEDPYSLSSSDSLEVIDVVLPVGTETWSELSVTAHRSSSSQEEYADSSSAYTLEWAGSLLPSWPADYSVSATRSFECADIASTQQTGWHHPGCDLAVESNSSDIVSSNPDVPFYSVSLESTVLEIKRAPSTMSLQEAWLDGVCVGQVDETTWEVIGACE